VQQAVGLLEFGAAEFVVQHRLERVAAAQRRERQMQLLEPGGPGVTEAASGQSTPAA
jgi:hypothetical protein